MANKQLTAQISITLDKRTVERIRLAKKVAGKGKEAEINAAINKALLPVIDSIEAPFRLKKDSWKTAKICPKCTGGMLFHKVRSSDSKIFYGCSNFPTCKNTEDA